LRRLFTPLVVILAAMFAYAPLAIHHAPYESTMGLVQKIFYFHFPSWIAMFGAACICGVASAVFIFAGRRSADRLAVAAAEQAVLFGLIGLITGPLWGRKAWGVWWQWDARLTSALVMWLVFIAYLLLRKYGGPGSEKLSAVLALFGMANVPFVYWSVNVWRTVHPKTTVVMTLDASMLQPLLLSTLAFVGLLGLMLAARVQLEKRRADLDELYLALED
jgi:heme exporter protein C